MITESIKNLLEVRLKRPMANGGDTKSSSIDLILYQALLAECLTRE